MTKVITLHFYGYTWEEYAFQISNMKGIFVVFSGKLIEDGNIGLCKILYIGYHAGISELYENQIIDKLKPLMNSNERIFFSFSEIPHGEDYKIIESKLNIAVNPSFKRIFEPLAISVRIICEGSRGLLPKEV